MCLLCHQLVGEGDWTDAGVATGQPASERHRRRDVIATVLGCYGLDYRHGVTGAPALVSNRKGAVKVATGLSEVWDAAETLAGRPLDPLEPVLLERLADD